MTRGYTPRWNSYEALADAKTRNATGAKLPGVLDVSKGGHLREQPYAKVVEVLTHAASGRNLISFLTGEAERQSKPLAELLADYAPPDYFVDLPAVYRQLHAHSGEKRPLDAYLRAEAERIYPFAQYPAATLGHAEPRYLARSFFIHAGVPAQQDAVIAGHGFKMLYLAALAALSSVPGRDRTRRLAGGAVILPRGHYHSLTAPLDLLGLEAHIVPQLDAPSLRDALRELGARAQPVRAILYSNTSCPEGKLDPEPNRRALVEVILDHNTAHAEAPVRVIDDLLYAYSTFAPNPHPPALCAVRSRSGHSLSPHTITIVSPSKTFAFPSARVGFATSGDRALLYRAGDWLRQVGDYHTFFPAELGAAAALALTPRAWIEDNNRLHAARFERARRALAALNARALSPAFEMSEPEAGWYVVVELRPDSIPQAARASLRDSEDLQKYLAHYGRGRLGTGLLTYPGTVLGYPPDRLLVRISLALSEDEIDEVFARLEHAFVELQTLTSTEIGAIVQHASYSGPTKTSYTLFDPSSSHEHDPLSGDRK